MCRYNRAPKIAAHKLDNLSVVFNFLDKAGIKTLAKPQNVLEGNITMILGLMWTLILEFDINRAMKAAAARAAVGQGQRSFDFKPGAAKDNLLGWTRAHTSPYDQNPQNFDKDFSDGKTLLALVHSLRPDLFKWNEMDKTNPRANVVTAMNLADQHMGIPPLLDPDSLTSGHPDEKSVMTYVVNFMTYESENHEKVTKLQYEFGEQARQAEVKKQEQVSKQREAIQREQRLLDEQRRAQEEKMRAEEQRQQEELEKQRADLEKQRRQLEEMGAKKTAEMANKQRELLQREQQVLEEQRRAQDAKIKEEEKRQAEELARQQREIDDQRRAMEEARQAEERRNKERMQQQREEMERQQREIDEQRRAMEEMQKRQSELEKSKIAAQQKELEEQRRLIDEQKSKVAELEKRKIEVAKQQLEEEKRALAEQQRQLKSQEDQKRKLLELEKQKADLAKQQRELKEAEEKRRAVLMKQQDLLRQKAALDQERAAIGQAGKGQVQNRNLMNLQMAPEVRRMSFFQAVAERQVRDYVLFVDKSGSMAGNRWDEARKAVESLAPQVTRACPLGISLYFFNDECVRIDNVTTAQQVAGFFAKEKPDRGTNLHLAFKHAFNTHGKKREQPETWLVITDGAPDKPTHVYELLKQESAKFKSGDEVTISFIQIGNDEKATEYLRKMRGALPFVDTLTQEDLPKRDEFSTLFTTE